MRQTSIEHQRDIDEFQRREIEAERAEHEREVEEANNAPLFNIPASVWRRRWSDLHGEHDLRAAYLFWLGVYCGSSTVNSIETGFLYDVAFLLGTRDK